MLNRSGRSRFVKALVAHGNCRQPCCARFFDPGCLRVFHVVSRDRSDSLNVVELPRYDEFSLNVGLGVMSYEEAAEEAWNLYNSCVEGQC